MSSFIQPIIQETSARQDPAAFFEHLPDMVLPRGAVLFEEHHADTYLYYLVQGIVKLITVCEGKEVLEDYYLSGELLNCEALLFPHRSSVIAEAMTRQVIVKKIPIQTYRQAMRAQPGMYDVVIENLTNSLYRTRERLRSLNLMGSQQRVIHFLTSWVARSGRQVGYEWVLKPFPTHGEIGDLSDTSRQTVSVVLNQLRKAGIVHFNRAYLIVRDWDALKKLL